MGHHMPFACSGIMVTEGLKDLPMRANHIAYVVGNLKSLAAEFSEVFHQQFVDCNQQPVLTAFKNIGVELLVIQT